MREKEIIFNNNKYSYTYDENDVSGLGCEFEIVTNNEYGLHRFGEVNDKIFVDIGANHGLATIILAKQNPLSKIFSFEPNPIVFKILKSNVINNGLGNVILVNKAVHSNKDLKLMKHPYCSGANIMSNDASKINKYYITQNLHQNPTEISVETISFDEFLLENDIIEIFLLKIDCEGSEFDILGNSNLLFDKITISNIVGEFHDLSYNDVKFKSANLMKLCTDNIHGIIDVSILKQ